MDLQRLMQTQGPWLQLLVEEPAKVGNLPRAIEQQASFPLAVRQIRGRKSMTKVAFFDEMAAALQFPLYFGDNWDALYDCLSDLSWLRAEGVVLLLADAGQVLKNAPADQLPCLVRVLEETVRNWNQPPKPGKPRPFHVLLHTSPLDEAATRKRWQAAGLALGERGA